MSCEYRRTCLRTAQQEHSICSRDKVGACFMIFLAYLCGLERELYSDISAINALYLNLWIILHIVDEFLPNSPCCFACLFPLDRLHT